MSWNDHVNTLVGNADRQAAILTQTNPQVCAASPNLEVDTAEAAQILSFAKKGDSPVQFNGEGYTAIAYSDDKNVVTLVKKRKQAGDGLQPVLGLRPQEFLVVCLTNTLMFLIKVGPQDNHVDAAATASRLRDYLVASNY